MNWPGLDHAPHAQTATGEASGSAGAALRNPGFVFKHARGAAMRARSSLDSLIASAEPRGFDGMRSGVELQAAKLALREKRHDDARAHLERVLERMADEPDATFAKEAVALLKAERHTRR